MEFDKIVESLLEEMDLANEAITGTGWGRTGIGAYRSKYNNAGMPSPGQEEEESDRRSRARAIEKDRGPWWITIEGRYVNKGPWDWFRGANAYAGGIVKNRKDADPEIGKKIKITRTPPSQ